MKTYRTYSARETKKLGRDTARALARPKAARATILALTGDLGAGKTTFVQGFMEGLGVKRKVPSPTFIIMKRYKVKHPHFANAHHMDAYRLRKADDVGPLGFKELLADPRNLLLIEWPENIKGALPRGAKAIIFQYGRRENERLIKI